MTDCTCSCSAAKQTKRRKAEKPEGSLQRISFIKGEDIKPISTERFIRPYGILAPRTTDAVAEAMRVLIRL